MDKQDLGKKTVTLSMFVVSSLMSAGAVRAMGGGGGGCVTANLTISVQQAPLHFGDITTPTVACTVTVEGNNQKNATCVTGTMAHQPVRIRVGGTGGKADVNIVQTTATITSAGNSMTVTSFDFQKKGGGATLANINLPRTTNIGAVMNATAGQPGGVYTGTFTVNAVCR